MLLASPSSASSPHSGRWSAQLKREVDGRDCVVFFDEIDQHAGHDAFASELRQFLDGVCQPVASRVLLVGTTNCIEMLPEDVLHRAEVITFERPEAFHLAEMWRGFAQHLPESDISKLSASSEQGGLTGRDVRHCASWAERRTAIEFLNRNSGMGYGHGAALSSCPLPSTEHYARCIQQRSSDATGPGILQTMQSWWSKPSK